MLRPRAALALLLGSLLATLTTGCSGSSGEGSRPVTVAASDHLGGAPVYLAEDRGLWAVEARVRTLATGRDALNAVLGGQAAFGVVGDLPAVTAALNGRDVKVLAELSAFSDWRLLTRTDRAVTGFDRLRGRRVGVPRGTNVEYALSRMLAAGHLTSADVTVVNLAPNQVPAALARGDVDAGVTFPSFYDATRSALGARYAELPFSGYTARTLLVCGPAADERTATAVLRSVVRAQRELAADPAAARRSVLAQAKGSLKAAYVERYQPRYTYRSTLSADLLRQLHEEAVWAKAAQGLSGPSDEAAMRRTLRPGPLKAVDPAAVTVG
ncbi:ABC transporter substrate-binding protein [Streptomyces sp. NRRL S-87]|uniref:ABC transporter substrate-binding protein n=1 Tax=Streptomyces sp. NRRL S-87 TaxID=1463920 RepID=UPI0004BEE5E8|nr:NrtA/SsuA/CpmA family ABC transporter substrate-binding protein [Streptomyces sp. NRRL S-87]